MVSGQCLDGVSGCLGCMNTKSLSKILQKVIKLRYYLFFQCPILHKTPKLVVSVLCLGVSAQCLECIRGLRRSHDEAIPNPLAKFELGRTWILPFLLVPSIAKKHLCLLMSGWCYFEGVWIMSRWCLRVSGEASMPNLFMILRYCLSSSARNSYHLNPVLSAAVRILESFDMMIMIGKVKCSV